MTLTDELERFHRAVTSGAEDDDGPGWAVGTELLGAHARLGIYRYAYQTRLIGALRDLYPRAAASLGDRFPPLAWGWMLAHPPTQWSLFHIAPDLADGLHGAVRDLARLDDARRVVFDEVDEVAVSVASLRMVAPADWPALRFRRVAASRWLDLGITVADDGADATHEPAPSTVLVWREGATASIRHRALSPTERALIVGLDAGLRLDAVAEAVAQTDIAEPAAALMHAFGRAAQEGWLRLDTAGAP